jgi:CRP-like cAMP-binding protein
MPLKLVTSGALENRMLTQSMPALDNRHHQAFPLLLESEVHRVREFGSVREFTDGDTLQKIGDIARGLAIVLSGEIEVVQYDISRRSASVAAYGPGAFMGELAQLAGRPALVDAFARGSRESAAHRTGAPPRPDYRRSRTRRADYAGAHFETRWTH